MMKKSLLLVFLIISSFSFSQEKWTLEMCVKRAIDENISIKQSELDYVDSEINRKNAIGNFIPNINIGSSSFSITTEQKIAWDALSLSSVGTYDPQSPLSGFTVTEDNLTAQPNLDKLSSGVGRVVGDVTGVAAKL